MRQPLLQETQIGAHQLKNKLVVQALYLWPLAILNLRQIWKILYQGTVLLLAGLDFNGWPKALGRVQVIEEEIRDAACSSRELSIEQVRNCNHLPLILHQMQHRSN
jgi:hypothetical protein